MNKLYAIQLQALDYALTRLQNITKLDEYKIVIKYGSKLVYGDFLLPLYDDSIIETYFKADFSNSFKLKNPHPTFFDDVYNSVLYNLSVNEKSDDYINVIIDALVSKIKEVDISKKDQYPRPVIYNAVFLESGLKLPFIQLNHDDEYEFVSFVDTKLLQN